MKRLRIGRRRQQVAQSSPLELARAPAFDGEKWRIPDRFNFTRDLVEVLAANPKRQALTFVGPDSVIEPRTFHELAEGANKWAYILTDRGLGPGDRVLVLSDASVDWVEIMLGCIKAGIVAVPCSPYLSAAALESRVSVTGASLIVASDEAKSEIAQMSFAPEVHHIFEGRRRRATDAVEPQPTADTSSREVALLVWTSGTAGPPKPVAHTHGWTFAARSQAEHWLDAGPGDVVWCAAPPGSTQALLGTLFGPWARGAQVVLRDGELDPMERLELIHRFQATILHQSPADYRALAERHELPRFHSRRLRRLVSTGDYLDPDVVATFEEAWGLTIHNGYGQTETGIVVGNGRPPAPVDEDELAETEEVDAPAAPGPAPAGSLGRALPGHHVAVVDEQGNELPPGVEGSLAVRGRPPTLFAGYWDSPDETRDVFRGDWYVTGDVAVADEHGVISYVGRSQDVIASRGRTFGPHEVERALTAHRAVVESAVVGIRDLQRGGHFVRAFVVLAPGAEGSEQLEAELRGFVSESVAEQQVPREIVFVDELPRSASGVIRRAELRDRPVAGRPLWETTEAPQAAEAELQTPPVSTAAAASGWGVEVTRAEEPDLPPVVEQVAEALPAFPSSSVVEPEVVPAPELPTAPIAPPSAVELLPEPVAEVESPPTEREASADLPVEPAAQAARPEPSEPEQGMLLEPLTEETTPITEVVDAPEPSGDTAAAPEQPGEEPVTRLAVAPEQESPAVTEAVEEAVALPSTDDTALPAVRGRGYEGAVEPEPFAPWPEPSELPPTEPEPVAEVAARPEPGPEPEPEPEASPSQAPAPTLHEEPLPDYVVDPSHAPQPVPPPAPELAWPEPEEEEEEDLGPLPEYVVDPERRLEVVPDPEPAAEPPPPPAPTPVGEDGPALPAFPPTPVLDLGATDTAARAAGDDGERTPRQRPRRQAAEAGTAKRGSSAAEPGDEAGEATWMRGLSSRLSHYSLGAEADADAEGEAEEGSEVDEDVERG